MKDVYPLLKPHNWEHKHLVAYRLITDKVDGVPIIAFGYSRGDNYQFVPRHQCNNVEQLYSEAVNNLAKLDYEWDIGDREGFRFAASSGKDFSAEKILDTAAMLKCHNILESDRIVAAAPRRTCLFAARYGLPEIEMSLFIRVMLYTYHDDSYGHAPISPALFILEEGIIKRVAFVQ